MTTVGDLEPGDVAHGEFDMHGRAGLALFVARTDHPVYNGLDLVVWRMGDGRWSHDALDPRQDIGTVIHRGGPTLVRAGLGRSGDDGRWLTEVPF